MWSVRWYATIDIRMCSMWMVRRLLSYSRFFPRMCGHRHTFSSAVISHFGIGMEYIGCSCETQRCLFRLLLLYASDKQAKARMSTRTIRIARYIVMSSLPRWFDCHWYLRGILYRIWCCVFFIHWWKCSKQIKRFYANSQDWQEKRERIPKNRAAARGRVREREEDGDTAGWKWLSCLWMAMFRGKKKGQMHGLRIFRFVWNTGWYRLYMKCYLTFLLYPIFIVILITILSELS